MHQRGIFTKKFCFFYFSPFLRILPGDLRRVFPQTVTYCVTPMDRQSWRTLDPQLQRDPTQVTGIADMSERLSECKVGLRQMKIVNRALDNFSTRGVSHFQCARARYYGLAFIDFGDWRKKCLTNLKYPVLLR
jgi:hypothetical protein